MEVQIHPDFDWVAERGKCTADGMFVILREMAQKNVETRNGLSDLKDRQPPRFLFSAESAGEFKVIDVWSPLGRTGVMVCTAGDEIHVYRSAAAGQPVAMKPVLSIAGRARILHEGAELEPWQALRKVLEPLFFAGDTR